MAVVGTVRQLARTQCRDGKPPCLNRPRSVFGDPPTSVQVNLRGVGVVLSVRLQTPRQEPSEGTMKISRPAIAAAALGATLLLAGCVNTQPAAPTPSRSVTTPMPIATPSPTPTPTVTPSPSPVTPSDTPLPAPPAPAPPPVVVPPPVIPAPAPAPSVAPQPLHPGGGDRDGDDRGGPDDGDGNR